MESILFKASSRVINDVKNVRAFKIEIIIKNLKLKRFSLKTKKNIRLRMQTDNPKIAETLLLFKPFLADILCRKFSVPQKSADRIAKRYQLMG